MDAKTSVVACACVPIDSLYREYHDEEWGVLLHDDQKLFEFLVLDGMQASLIGGRF